MSITLGAVLQFDEVSATVDGTQNDFNPTDLAKATALLLTGINTPRLNGIAGGASHRVIFLVNVGSNNISLSGEDAGSVAGNRFAGTRTLFINQVMLLIYDGVSSRWRWADQNV